MEFHFVKLNVNGTYLSLVDPTSKPRFMCFPSRESADKCVHYVSTFRSKHGIWPCFDMSNGKRKLESSAIKFRSPEQIRRYMEIESYDFSTLDKIASRTNSSFYCVLQFDVADLGNIESISMSGQEMDAIVDEDAYRDLLEFKLKCE